MVDSGVTAFDPTGVDRTRSVGSARTLRVVLVAAHGVLALPDTTAPSRCCARPRRDLRGGTSMDPRQNDELVTALRAAARSMAGRRSLQDLEETLGQIVTSA